MSKDSPKPRQKHKFLRSTLALFIQEIRPLASLTDRHLKLFGVAGVFPLFCRLCKRSILDPDSFFYIGLNMPGYVELYDLAWPLPYQLQRKALVVTQTILLYRPSMLLVHQ